MTLITRQDILAHQAVVPWAAQYQVEQDLLLCRAMVALFDDALLSSQIAMPGGTPEVLDFVRRHESAWRWWNNPDIQRPLVSIVAITPVDEFEPARPAHGVALRVRCAFENTAQGQPKNPITELVKLTLDGAEVSPRLVARPQPRAAAYADHYHEFHIPNPSPGTHSATAVVRVIETRAVSSRTVHFVV